jgi:hypothetical protein
MCSSLVFSSETRSLNTAIIGDIRAFFDRSLSKMLLYRFERAQYRAILERMQSGEAGSKPSDHYGAHHLLRLFRMFANGISLGLTRAGEDILPSFIDQSGISEETRNQVFFYIAEILE